MTISRSRSLCAAGVLLVVVGLLAVAGGAAADTGPWKPVTVTRTAGAVSAVMTYEKRDAGYESEYRRLKVVVKNGGKTLYSRMLCAPATCGGGSQHELKLENVWGGSAKEAVLGIYTGGAHCCFETTVILVDGPRAGRVLHYGWGDPGYHGEVHDGQYQFITADDRFAYEFTYYAASGFPTQVLVINEAGTKFVDVTRTRLDLVREDAASYWKSYLHYRGSAEDDSRGLLAAWCADQYLLGTPEACTTELASALKAGYLAGDTLWPAGAKFGTALHKRLVQWGYA